MGAVSIQQHLSRATPGIALPPGVPEGWMVQAFKFTLDPTILSTDGSPKVWRSLRRTSRS
jgi:hypothetical protein